MSMDTLTVADYWQSMLAIRSAEQLGSIQSCDAPHLKSSDRSKLIKSLNKQANPKLLDEIEKPRLSTLEAAKALVRRMDGRR